MNREEYRTGLWEKKSEKGNTYYSGKIKLDGKEYKLQLFKTEIKKSEKSPDYTLFIRDNIINRDNQKDKNMPLKNSELQDNPLADEVFADFGSKIDLEETPF